MVAAGQSSSNSQKSRENTLFGSSFRLENPENAAKPNSDTLILPRPSTSGSPKERELSMPKWVIPQATREAKPSAA